MTNNNKGHSEIHFEHFLFTKKYAETSDRKHNNITNRLHTLMTIQYDQISVYHQHVKNKRMKYSYM